jgi:hypothetical protein
MTTGVHPRGVFCAALTPVAEDLSPDHARFTAHCRRLLEEGCDGIALLGTTGEANSFSSAERQGLLEATVAAGIAPDRLLPSTGVAALTETVALTRHALSLGVTTVVMLPPFYYKGITEDGLFAAYAEVAERVADPRLRIVLYHIPQMSAVPIPFPVIARLREAYPGTFTGIKDSAGDLSHMEALVERFPGIAVLAGADPLMLHHGHLESRRRRPRHGVPPLRRPRARRGGRGGAGADRGGAEQGLALRADGLPEGAARAAHGRPGMAAHAPAAAAALRTRGAGTAGGLRLSTAPP